MSEARYTLPDGNTAFTSEFLLTRGTCCHSGCLHCPYGFTLANFGIEFHQNNNQDFIDTVLRDNGLGTDIASQLLQQNLGVKKSFNLSRYSADQIFTMTIKNVACGILVADGEKIIKYFLEKHFMSQGITDIRVEDFFKNRH